MVLVSALPLLVAHKGEAQDVNTPVEHGVKGGTEGDALWILGFSRWVGEVDPHAARKA